MTKNKKYSAEPKIARLSETSAEIDAKPVKKEKTFNKKPFDKDNNKGKKSFAASKNGKPNKFNNAKGDKKTDGTPAPPVDKKELYKQRKQKKLAENYDVSISMKKIWETLRRFRFNSP